MRPNMHTVEKQAAEGFTSRPFLLALSLPPPPLCYVSHCLVVHFNAHPFRLSREHRQLRRTKTDPITHASMIQGPEPSAQVTAVLWEGGREGGKGQRDLLACSTKLVHVIS